MKPERLLKKGFVKEMCKGNQEESEQNEVDGIKKGADSTGKVMHM